MFMIPPCPKCSGVLRSLDYDAARCRCGFEVDGIHLYAARRLPEDERAAHLLARGRMVPIPQHEPGIRVGPDAGALWPVGWDHRYEPWRPGETAVVAKAVDGTAIERGHEIGLVHVGEAPGAMLALPDGRTLTERRMMYGLAPAGCERECARRMVDAIVAAHGPGRWWTLAGAVHFIFCDGTDAAVCDIGGVPHVALRSLYFHDPNVIRTPVGDIAIKADVTLQPGEFRLERSARPRADGFSQERIDALKAAMLAPAPRAKR